MKKKTDYNQIKAGYYDLIHKKNKGIQSAWHHIKFNFISEKIDNKNNHLDIGCGPGTFIGLLKNTKSIGIDISKQQVLYAKKNYGNKKKLFYHFKKKIPLKNSSVESITLIELIEHLDNKELSILMKECKRVLKIKGSIHITTPNYYSLWPILEIILNFISPYSYKHQHINKFYKKKLEDFLNLSNFKTKKVESFIFLSPFLAPISFKTAISFIRIDNFLCKFFPGFLLYAKTTK